MENPDPGSGIRDKNHRSATLVRSKVRKTVFRTLYSCASASVIEKNTYQRAKPVIPIVLISPLSQV
jgi:hypothetical protein